MKQVYQASDVLEAHVVQGMLAQYNISAFIQGQHSVGGTGELAPQQGTDLWVNNDDYVRARELIAEYEANNQHNPEHEPRTLSLPKNIKWLYWAAFIMIVVETFRYF